jgi:hypothetical protein
MSSPALRRAAVATTMLAVALSACEARPPDGRGAKVGALSSAAPVSTAPASPASEAAITAPSGAPASPVPRGAAGPVYVLVEGAGVLRIREDEVTRVRPPPKDTSAWFVEMLVAPDGDLWLSDWEGVHVLPAAGGPWREIPRPGTQLYAHLNVLSPSDAWAVTSDSEWSILHYDGRSWTPVRQRSDFPGFFSDNKLGGVAVDAEGVWVASWNGLYRLSRGSWQKIETPAGEGRPDDLLVYKGHLVAGNAGGGYLVREREGWKKLPWPDQVPYLLAVSDLGLGVARRSDGRLEIGPIDAPGPRAVSDPIPGFARTVVVDGAGRTWVGTSSALTVLDRAGRTLSRWTSGTLDGMTGAVARIAVTGAGPRILPVPKKARTWSVVGRFQTAKRRRPLANATLELCADHAPGRGCPGSSLVWRGKTAANGSFRFDAASDGDYWIEVKPPPDEEDCDSLFHPTGHPLRPARDCKEDPGAPGVCDLGVLTDCHPWEMPPPPPHR